VILFASPTSRFAIGTFLFSIRPIFFPKRPFRFVSGRILISGAAIRFGRGAIRFDRPNFRFSGAEGPVAALDDRMTYTMADLEALTGLTARTIRDYIHHGYLTPPAGRGPGATYDEEQMLRVVTIARMRAQKQGWEKIAARLKKSSLAKLRAFVEQTEPKPPAAAPPSVATDDLPALEGEPVEAHLPPRHPEADTTTELDVRGDGRASNTSGGTRLVMEPVLPGLVLLVNEDAAPLVRRVVAEILATYRVSR
jgi:hypothetical protein